MTAFAQFLAEPDRELLRIWSIRAYAEVAHQQHLGVLPPHESSPRLRPAVFKNERHA